MDRLLIVLVALSLTGCSTSKPATYPPAELVQVSPTADGHGVNVGFNVRAVKDHGIVRVVKDNPWKSTLAGALSAYGIYEGGKAMGWWAQDSKPVEPQPDPSRGSVILDGRGAFQFEFEGVTGGVKVEKDAIRESGSGGGFKIETFQATGDDR